MPRSAAALLFSAALVATLGAGCFSSEPAAPAQPAPSPAAIRGAVAGDTVVLEEPAGIVNGKWVDGPLTRRVTLNAFVLGQTSDASWALQGAGTSTVVASSTWTKASLNTAHPFYLPGAFGSRYRPAGDASVLWLAQQEFNELRMTSGTTLDPRFKDDPAWDARFKADAGAYRAFVAMKKLMDEADKARLDLTYAKIDGAPVERTFTVGGKTLTANVIPVRNWYGTFEILDRADNPLVVSFKLDPKAAKNRLDVSAGDGARLAKLVDYRVKELGFVGQQ